MGKEVLGYVVRPALAALLLDHQAQQNSVCVAVLVLGSGRELQRLVKHIPEQLLRSDGLMRVGDGGVAQFRHVVECG
jgi:hypothetical protein